ncbi:hypothetical protein D3C81_1852230 [compost metagenome]
METRLFCGSDCRRAPRFQLARRQRRRHAAGLCRHGLVACAGVVGSVVAPSHTGKQFLCLSWRYLLCRLPAAFAFGNPVAKTAEIDAAEARDFQHRAQIPDLQRPVDSAEHRQLSLP